MLDVLDNIDKERCRDRYLKVLALLGDEEHCRKLAEQQKIKEEKESIENEELEAWTTLLFPTIAGGLLLFFGLVLTRSNGFIHIESMWFRIPISFLLFLLGYSGYMKVRELSTNKD
ncbi:hypothetical protein Ssed_1056 [Shewanella sediminis HAW-EB3]|uniref:Uncharacterized protein n=1 Tax=Shewanella sediminis (strain HAW-EB3) TaxID=425104 RepID=A8FS44_SHESH|nr:hypothetical protein Ssed_1056 [Shewanella sediminis HAW-EB3]